MSRHATYVCVPRCDNDEHHPACNGQGNECHVTQATPAIPKPAKRSEVRDDAQATPPTP